MHNNFRNNLSRVVQNGPSVRLKARCTLTGRLRMQKKKMSHSVFNIIFFLARTKGFPKVQCWRGEWEYRSFGYCPYWSLMKQQYTQYNWSRTIRISFQVREVFVYSLLYEGHYVHTRVYNVWCTLYTVHHTLYTAICALNRITLR